jgi:prepilin-type N-terminal cleavage/methylation domain-containing protein
MKNKATRNNMRGFSLMEMLVTVLILVILFALAMIPISKIQKNLRQTELDSRAEMIFSAVQNRMTRLQAAGQDSYYQPTSGVGVEKLNMIPKDADEEKYKDTTLAYVTSADKNNKDSAASWIYPETEAEADLWDGSWVVEFDPSSGSVYAVFFSREDMNYTPESFKDLRYRDKRLENGAKIGYYGGDSVGAAATESLDLTVDVINKDQLLVVASCKVNLRNKPQFYAVIKDESGHTVKEFEIEDGAVDTVKTENGLRTATLVLDNLSTGKNLRFGQQERFNKLIPGENLTVTIRVKDENNNQIQGTSKTVTTNSLFAEVRDDASGIGRTGRTAVIKYGRHLQNLEEASGLTPAITAAVQERDIQFKSDESDSWGVLYPTQNFVPLVNPKINSYHSKIGSYCPVIYDLTVDTTDTTDTTDAGLFQTFAGELKNIRLAGAQIKGSGNVGGLVGKLTGETTIDGCQVYLSRAKGQLNEKTEKDIWIDGAVSGGLVGDTDFSALTIQNSLAATVIQGKTAAGGLVGIGHGGISLDHSYADCYLYSDPDTTETDAGYAGGLIGWRYGATTTLKITDCYAAGFLVGKTTAGLVACDLSADNNTLQNVYSACVPLTAEKLTYGTVILNKNQGDGSYAKKVYYLGKSVEPTIGTQKDYDVLNAPNADTLFDSKAFTRQNSDTYAYNLMKGLGLTLYSYPKLKNLPHYGDWKAKFENGALVYYEQYDGNSYGFFGANVEALSDKPVTGDGYGVVYEKNLPTDPVIVTVNDHPYELKPKDKIPIKVTDKAGTEKTYYLLPLPAKLVQNVIDVPTGFYTELKVGAAGKAYYYNPHFAKTAMAAKTGTPELVSIRTARQLYALSEYYDKYRDILPKDAAFQQERDIDYAAYVWAKYGKDEKVVTQQTPIGQTEKTAFKHRYDGGSHIITGVSFASGEDGPAVGLFGFTTGTLENIVVTTKEPLKTAPTSKLGGNVQWKTVYTGVLAGKNSGTIKNCAVSGYRLSGSAYSGSTYYLGGLVGCNEGLIQACSADIPSITGTSTYAQSYCDGGLVGMNDGSGQIRQSYAIGSIKLTEIRGSAVISGFAGENRGVIRNCYCAMDLNAVTGADVNGFSTDLGSVTKCYYLNGSTHTFAGAVRLYDYKAGTSSGAQPRDHKQMKALASELDGFAAVDDAAHSINHQNTDPSETVYPYPSSVTAADKKPVHYGDWVTDADMGTIGMVYWEKEEGGANSGYHFSYIGFTGTARKEGSSLCTAHDDGGKITDFGYGYYCKDKTSGKLTPSDNFVLEGKNDAAEKALAKQVPGYTFTCYRTDGKDGLQLSAETKSNSDSFTLAANGTWTLQQNGKPYTYAVCPFFGDSYCPVEDVGNAQNLGKTGAKKQYQIRSVEQLQFINWSCEVIPTNIGYWWKPKYSFTFNTGTDRPVTSETYKQFPYLQYATVAEKGEQKMSAALKNRPQRSWTQTHDLNGMALNAPADVTMNTVFYPIAGAVDDHTGSDYNVVLYTWFGGKYDGGNYYIKNIAIDSYCYNVGVFGTTAGATIENIMLYSDNDGVIQRSTGYTPSSGTRKENQYQCAYALGGLVGIAYDYQDNLGKSTIQNCAIAGYTVADNSKNKQQLGEAVVGGLIGVSNVNLMKCTAVVDIQINCTHRDNNENGALNAPQWGTFVRVGGIAGGVRYSVTDCYSGGTITVGNETLRERVGNESGSLLDTKTLQFTNDTAFNMGGGSSGRSPATYIFLGGIGGSGFSSNFMNFTNSDKVVDGKPVYKNCYTYMIFPKLEGTINGISLIGSVADRFGQAEQLTIQNCYYLADSAKIDFFNALRAKGDSAKSSLADVYGGGTSNTAQETARKRMLQGDLRDMASVMWGSGKDKIYSIGLTERTYAQMSNRSDKTANNFQKKLGNGFGWVTNMENGSTIHGKYSFPGSDAALQGQDYPFPTVLRGTDSTGVTVNLHYGAWPKVGMLWNEGIVSLDLIADYVPSSEATKELKLNLFNVPEGTGTKSLEFTYSPEGVVTAKATKNETGDFAVTLTGVGTGATEVTADYGGYTARLMVTVTADLKVDLEPESVELNVGNEKAVQIKAVDKKNQAHTATWTVTSDNQEVAAVTEPADGQIKVTGVTAGETQLRITATCTVGGKDYTATAILPVTVKGDDTSITPDPGSGD